MPQNTVQAIIQDSDGYLWLGTQEGLARFDGVKFTTYRKGTVPELKSDHITALYEDHREFLWIGTRDGLIKYKKGVFQRYSVEEGLPHPHVLSVFMDGKGVLWTGTTHGVSRFQEGRFRPQPLFSRMLVKCFYEDARGVLWAGTDKGLARLEDHKITFFTTAQGLSGNTIQQVLEDHSGNLWVATYGGGLNWYADGEFAVISKADGLSSHNLNAIRLDGEGNLWIGTDGNGVNRLTNGRLSVLNVKNGLSNDYVGAFYEDPEGSLWIGTAKGLNRLKNGKLVTWTTHEGLGDNYVSGVYEDSKGTLWIGSYSGGLHRLEDEEISGFAPVNHEEYPHITALSEDRRGCMWIGTRGRGVLCYRDKKLERFTGKQGLSHPIVWAIYQDPEDRLWFGTGDGLNQLEDGKFRVWDVEDGLSSSNIYALISNDPGNLWIGTAGGGLNRLNHETGAISVFTTEDGLSDNIVYSLYHDAEKVLWIGTSYGLNSFNDGKITSFAGSGGLFNSQVFCILEDTDGYFWMSSNRGIFKVKREDLTRFSHGSGLKIVSTAYGVDEGMRDAECNGGFQPAGWKRRDGSLWFPTTEGLVSIPPGGEKKNILPPPVYIEKMEVNGEQVELSGGIQIGPGVDKLDIHYTALSYLAPHRVRFRFKMENFDRRWENVDRGRERIARYRNIPAGRYTFRVKACNNDGTWNINGAAIDLEVMPFFWETWWIRTLLLIVFATISYTGISLIKKYIHIFKYWKQKIYVGRYKIIEKIGSGGMGNIYLAKDTGKHTGHVALKVLRDEHSGDKQQVTRFKQEAVIIDQMDHPNIVNIIERGEHGNKIYIAMELLYGITLAEKIEDEGKLSVRDSVHIIRQVADALAVIHQKQVVHRDLKPENIMLTHQNKDEVFVKLLDFGIAHGEGFARMTESGMVMGTISYLAPEQIRESKYSPASDIYSLGVTFYEAITGMRPFFGDTTIEIMRQVLNRRPIMPRGLRQEIPGEIDWLIMKMIEKEPELRPPIKEVCEILSKFYEENEKNSK